MARGAPEKAVDAMACRVLRDLGFVITRLQQTRASRQTVGVPDLWVCHPGWGVHGWLELKAPRGRLSDYQSAWQGHARAAGANVATVHSVDELVAVLQAWGAPILD